VLGTRTCFEFLSSTIHVDVNMLEAVREAFMSVALRVRADRDTLEGKKYVSGIGSPVL